MSERSTGRVFAEESLTKIADAEACLTAVRVALFALEGRIESDRDREIVARFGSEARVRLLGGLFTAREHFPVRAICTVSDHASGRSIRVRVEENMGVGSLLGIEGKYRHRCEQFARHLIQKIAAAF